MHHPELPTFAFISALLVLVPLPWHWRARNVATVSISIWLFVVDIIYGVNTIVWAGNVNDPAPVWCDITSKIVVGASYALPLATICICKHLEMVSSGRKVTYDASDRRRRLIFEVIMCFFVPVVFMALHYIVQGHRYDVFEDLGCQATVYISVPGILLIWFPPLLFSVITLIFATLALFNFVRRRLTFAAHLHNSNSALTPNRYLRLIAMSMTQMAWGTTLTAYNLWINASPGLRPWTNWADVHSNFSRVDQYLLSEAPPWLTRVLLLFWWTMPASSLIFFVFFGFGEEAVKEYRKIWGKFRKHVLKKPEFTKDNKLFGSSSTSSKSHRPLQLLKLKTMSTSTSASSPSRDFSSISPRSATSHLSQSTITLASSPDGYGSKKSKFHEALEDVEAQHIPESAPPYYASDPSTHPHLTIGVPIDPSRGVTIVSEGRSSVVELDEGDAFTISTFSYYGQPSSPNSPASPTSTMVPHSPGLPLQSLPPPPRRFPRHSPSSSSVLTTVSMPSSNYIVPDHSEGPSGLQSSFALTAVPESERDGSRTLGVPVLPTIHRQASFS